MIIQCPKLFPSKMVLNHFLVLILPVSTCFVWLNFEIINDILDSVEKKHLLSISILLIICIIKFYCILYLRANIHAYKASNMMAYITPKQLLLINAYNAEYIFNLQTMDYKFILNSSTTPQCVFSKKGKHYLKVHTHMSRPTQYCLSQNRY